MAPLAVVTVAVENAVLGGHWEVKGVLFDATVEPCETCLGKWGEGIQ